MMIKVQKLFKKTLFGVFALFGLIGLSTSILCVYTVDTHLSGRIREQQPRHRQDHRRFQRGHSPQSRLVGFAVAHRSVRRDSGHQVHLHHRRIRRVSRPYLCAGHSRRNSRPAIRLTWRRWSAACRGWVISSKWQPILAGRCRHGTRGHGHRADRAKNPTRNRSAGLSLLYHTRRRRLCRYLVGQSGAKPLGALLGYAVDMARDGKADDDNLLAREDEAGHLARLFPLRCR